ncbi:MAG: hypothetical protein M0Z69_08475 [Actinomycetota bacterium]|nr:hypothetical protein [Actinomycetota bacterium]
MAEPNRADEAAQAAIARRLADAGFALPGTLLERTHVCGKPNCRCSADPPRPHGPFHQWTRKVDGKTVTRRLNDEQKARYGTWFDNAKRIRQLVAELEALSLRIAERDEPGFRRM